MSILIKKMEMPKGCWACPFAVGKHYECLFTKKSYNWGLTTRPSDCPLVEVPTPHGDLIDRNETIKAIGGRPHVGIGINDDDDEFDSGMSCQWGHDTGAIKDMPAIIEAEKE